MAYMPLLFLTSPSCPARDRKQQIGKLGMVITYHHLSELTGCEHAISFPEHFPTPPDTAQRCWLFPEWCLMLPKRCPIPKVP